MNKLKSKRTIQLAALFCILFCSCENQNSEQSNLPRFDVTSDILNLTNTLTENDTLTLLVNASICQSSQIDSLYFFKRSNKLYVNTTIQNWTSKIELTELGMVEYKKVNSTLNFETMFRWVINRQKTEHSSCVFTFIHKNDTLRLFSDNLVDHMEILDYYFHIQHRLYPDAKVYQPVYPPKPPE